jgi:hypothetical protein
MRTEDIEISEVSKKFGNRGSGILPLKEVGAASCR